jgi:hypothetical protein
VLGGEGFGFANEKGIWQKIAQIGGVTIGDDVEIGVNTPSTGRAGRYRDWQWREARQPDPDRAQRPGG